jgi:nitroreductase
VWSAAVCGLGLHALAALPPPIELPGPQTDGGRPLMQVLQDRKSTREFSTRPLAPQLLSNLLWAGFGVNRPASGHRTAPSAMNSQEMELYVATAEGVYRYEGAAHRLEPVLAGDFRPLTGGQAWVREAPLALILVADLARLAKAKPEERDFYAAIDAGFIAQNFYLFCASERLATVVHDFNRAPLAQALKLRPDQRVIITQSVGHPKS